MIPYVGSNVLNTSIIIGVFLLFLSFGYYKGGLVKDNYEKVLLSNLIYSAILVSIGLSSISLEYFFTFFKDIGNIYGLISFSFLIIAPIVYLLGQTIPIITNFMKNESTSKISGTLLFLSTLGSFLGSILTSVILLNFLGVKNTLLVYLSVFIFLIFILFFYTKVNKVKFLIQMLVLMLLIINLNLYDKYIYANLYSSTMILKDNKNIKYLNINNSLSSSYDKSTNSSTFKYLKIVKSIIENTKNKKEILVIGAGGFTVSLNDKLNKYTYIDIDKDLKKYSEKYFLNKKINGDFIAEDIRYNFSKSKKKYDIIILDAFSNKVSIPTFLLTSDFFAQVNEHLSLNGSLIINFVGNPSFSDKYSKHVNQTINSIYNCSRIPVDMFEKKSNIVYFCPSLNDNIIYTDNKINTLELVLN